MIFGLIYGDKNEEHNNVGFVKISIILFATSDDFY